MTAWIAVLLSLSALAELFGTITVWMNYSAGARLASVILADVAAEQEARNTAAREMPAWFAIRSADPTFPAMHANEAAERLLELRSQVGQYLGRDRWVSAGLWAYLGGAVTGLAAGYLALFR